MILKIITTTIVLFLVYVIFFRKSTQKVAKEKDTEEIMVECSMCGTYICKKETILSDGYFFCSKECLAKNKKP